MADDKSKDAGDDKSKEGDKPDLAKENADLKTKYADLEAKLAKLSKPKEDDEDLSDKAKKQRDADDKSKGDLRNLEASLKFNMGAEQFLKVNQSLLPKDVADLFKAADKETYDSAIQKANAIKAGIVQSFFNVQSNLDLLTPGLKTTLEEYLKLTKNGKQDRAQSVYDSVFEPAFEMLKRVKKAEQVNKGYGSGGDADEAYKQKMIAGSKKHYLGEKSDGT